MNILRWLLGIYDSDSESYSSDSHWTNTTDDTQINPATGLPMIGGVDVAGNPFGTDLSDYHTSSSGFNDDWSSSTTSSFDDDWSSSSTSGFDDDWGSGGFDDDW